MVFLKFIIRLIGFGLGVLLLLVSPYGMAQGWENFDHSNATSTYKDGSFEGNNAIVWHYIASRDENGDANNSGIDGKALMLRRASDNSKVYATNIPNGIQSFSVTLYKGFTTGGNRKVALFVNGVSYGESEGFNDFEAHLFEVENIDVEGEISIEIRNLTEYQVIVDDISWTAYDGTDVPPAIEEITQFPSATNVTPNDPVVVSAEITSAFGIQYAELYWGIDEDLLSNTIILEEVNGNVYRTATDIPPQIDGTTVYYQLIAWDTRDNNTLTPVFQYTVETPQWLSLPYTNAFREEDEWIQAQSEGFQFYEVNHEPAGEGYLKIARDGYVVSPPINFDESPAILTYFDLATWGGIRQQAMTVFVSEDNGESFGPLNTFSVNFPNAEYGTFAQYIDTSTLSGRTGRIKYQMTGGSASIRFRDLQIEPFTGFVYDMTWNPTHPVGVATAQDDVFVVNGETEFLDNIEMKNLFVSEPATLYVDNILKVHGDKLLVDGELIFRSSEDNEGELDELIPEIHLRGEVTVYRYLESKRAYRMLSSPVTTTASIRDNWQEGVNNVDPNQNQNPNPGFGTHITGNSEGDFGFDATADGSPSMFEEDVLEQVFVPITDTDQSNIQAGFPYLLFVRGDRGIDLSDTLMSSETTLRSRGKMLTGERIYNYPTMQEAQFAMFGNPYQSAIDVRQLFTFDSDKINIRHYYVYDPLLADEGAYVLVDLTHGSNFFDASVNQFLQPGYAATFTTVTDGGPQLIFKESHKTPGNRNESVMWNSDSSIVVKLYSLDNYTNAKPVHDALALDFNPYYNNHITPADALKVLNFKENIAIDNDGTLLVMEQRQKPVTGDRFQLYTSGYQHEDYVLVIDTQGLEDGVLYFQDYYLGEDLLLETGQLEYAFQVSENEPRSLSSDRFSIWVEYRLGISENNNETLVLYPNPMQNSTFYLQQTQLMGQPFELVVSDVNGREIMRYFDRFTSDTHEITVPDSLQDGIYMVTVTSDRFSQTFKITK